MREAVIIRKEKLVPGFGGLGVKDPLVFMHPVVIQNKTKGKNLTKQRKKPYNTPGAPDPEQGSPFPSAGQKRGLVSPFPAVWPREQRACRRWGGGALAEPAPFRAGQRRGLGSDSGACSSGGAGRGTLLPFSPPLCAAGTQGMDLGCVCGVSPWHIHALGSPRAPHFVLPWGQVISCAFLALLLLRVPRTAPSRWLSGCFWLVLWVLGCR